MKEEVKRSSETFIEHFQSKYNEETDLPLWMLTEIMSFENIYFLPGCASGFNQENG